MTSTTLANSLTRCWNSSSKTARAIEAIGELEPLVHLRQLGVNNCGRIESLAPLIGMLAKAYGAEVTGVCSTAKTELVRSLGADRVIDYTQEDFADGRDRHDIILDIAGNRSLSHLRRALAPEATLVIVGGEGGGKWFGGIDRQSGHRCSRCSCVRSWLR
jgi:hypothetical protein